MLTVIPYVCIFALVLSAMFELHRTFNIVLKVLHAIHNGQAYRYSLTSANTFYLAILTSATVYFWR